MSLKPTAKYFNTKRMFIGSLTSKHSVIVRILNLLFILIILNFSYFVKNDAIVIDVNL